jgi:hypothetical protein
MTRSFQAVDFIRLPKLSMAEAVTLAAALVARADAGGPLSAAIGKALGRVRAALGKLRVHTSDSADPPGESSTAARDADRDLDAAWAAAFAWCSGWTKLPYPSSSVTRADGLYRTLFAEGLKFTQYRYKVQWIESQARLEIIDAQNLDQHFAALGGTEILEAIRRAHARYGQVLGITSAAPQDAGAASERLAELGDEMSRYVLQVLASVDPDDRASQDMVDRLLEPLGAITTADAK